MNALEVRSIEDDVQQNKADISDLRVADKNFDVLLLQTISMINNINATVHGEMDNLDQRLTTVEERIAVCGYLESKLFSHSTTLNFDRVYDEAGVYIVHFDIFKNFLTPKKCDLIHLTSFFHFSLFSILPPDLPF